MDGIELPTLDLFRCVVPIVALLIGWAIGFFDSNLRTSKKIKAAENKAEIAIKEAKDKLAEAEARLADVPVIVPETDNLLRLSKENGDIALELDGQKISTPNLSAEQKKRLIGLLTLVRPWLEGTPVQQAGSRPAAPVPTAGTMQARPAPAPVAVTPPPLAPETKAPVARPLSIVEQIDSILQSQLVNTPLGRRDIRLQESREGGVEVIVGLERFVTVDDVPDPQIKSVIRAAIEEWENKYTPGL